MARIYSRKKGKSKSTKPIKKSVPSWQRYKPKEVELLVIKMAKDGKTPSQIGLFLRDTYGIVDVSVVTGKSITKILKDKKLAPKVPEDLTALIRKEVAVRKHLDENAQDKTALRGLQLTKSRINRLVKYYKNNKVLPLDWSYDPKKVSIFIE